jgi:phosphoribosylaminoimidazolecarboxamide formyltransferase/IMP cyclohydrolase
VQQILSDALSPQDSLAQRRKLAAKVFASLSYYDSKIALYLSEKAGGSPEQLADDVAFRLTKRQSLRYGENPHQRAAYYQAAENSDSKDWEQLQGKELSYNNLLDFDAALKIIKSFSSEKYAVAIIKHLNPCGAAVADSLGAALANAKKGDPRSHFGGIIALNAAVSAEVARLIGEDFAELVIAPEFEDAAMNIFSARKNLRVIRANLHSSTPFEIRTAAGGVLLQEPDLAVSKAALATVASKVRPSEAQLLDLQMAWVICSHVKSNAIVIAKNQTIIGVGAGQMSRIDSAELAISRARLHGHDLRGAVAASDAFFPFPDSIELLAEAGIRAVIAPSGAKRDADAVLAADRAGIALIFAADRHFRH